MKPEIGIPDWPRRRHIPKAQREPLSLTGEVAQRLGVSRDVLYHHLRRPDAPAPKLRVRHQRYFAMSEVLAWWASFERAPGRPRH